MPTFASLCEGADERLFYTRSPMTRDIFYIHSCHHGVTDTIRFGNECMTLNFLIVH